MENPSTIMWGVLFGSIGLGFFVYGKKQKVIMPMVCGAGLMGIPYFITNLWIMVLICLVLLVLPFVIKI